jgi:Single-strand binding protein family
VARFRVASTPRFRHNATGERKDGEPLFLTCNAWRQLAENAVKSLDRGSRVIVSGRLRQRSQRAAMAEPDRSAAGLLLEGIVLRLQADLRWLEACERNWTGPRSES